MDNLTGLFKKLDVKMASAAHPIWSSLVGPVEATSAAEAEPPKTVEKEETQKNKTSKMSLLPKLDLPKVELKEQLMAGDGYLCTEDMPSFVFCKPKLIPLKTIPMQRQEELRQRQLASVQQQEGSSAAVEDNEKVPGLVDEDAPADIWSADD